MVSGSTQRQSAVTGSRDLAAFRLRSGTGACALMVAASEADDESERLWQALKDASRG